MEWFAMVGGISTGVMGIITLAIWWRCDGLKASAEASRALMRLAQNAAIASGDEFDRYRERSEAKEKSLIEQLEHYENHELDAIEEEPDRDKRIRRRRAWVSGVLSETISSPDVDQRGMR